MITLDVLLMETIVMMIASIIVYNRAKFLLDVKNIGDFFAGMIIGMPALAVGLYITTLY